MVDPWSDAARRIENERDRREREEAAKQAARDAEWNRKVEESARLHRILEAAIDEATPRLERFLRQRGEAAAQLLAATDSYVMFGADSEGGYYASVRLDRSGLVLERGQGSSYSSRPTGQRAATFREAVEYFANHGSGSRDPKKIAGIVAWLEHELNDRAER